ncbi:hypothetical protein Salat_0040500 [Sesamum alatum]|uniref:Uncharacterized protein n=1 Tax=Sesamum alatum TaxID=300844 RepID=A0AAE1YVN4_9LAMI|nr:hypothetical protein Salat_0040500 [Sesamum alatum]
MPHKPSSPLRLELLTMVTLTPLKRWKSFMNNGGISLVMKTLVPSSSRLTTPTLKPASDHILMPFCLPQSEARHARRVLIAGNEGSVYLLSSAATRVFETLRDPSTSAAAA